MKLISLATLAVGGAAAAAIFLNSGVAHADPAHDNAAYLQQMTDDGLVITNINAALNTGYAICAALPTTNGEDVAWFMLRHQYDVLTIDQARIEVLAAAQNLCPSQDHTHQHQTLT